MILQIFTISSITPQISTSTLSNSYFIKTQSYIQLSVVGGGRMGPIPLIQVEPWKAPTRISPPIADRTHIIFSLCGILLSFKQISVFFYFLPISYLIDISWQTADILWSWHLGSLGLGKINIVLWNLSANASNNSLLPGYLTNNVLTF